MCSSDNICVGGNFGCQAGMLTKDIHRCNRHLEYSNILASSITAQCDGHAHGYTYTMLTNLPTDKARVGGLREDWSANGQAVWVVCEKGRCAGRPTVMYGCAGCDVDERMCDV